jgi:hypothetical protein
MGQPSAETLAQLMLGIGVLLGLLIAGVLLVQRFRGGAADKGPTPSDLMSNFQEMHSRGDISEADYRKIKSVIGSQVQARPNDGKDKP